jgi:hypothetical protein
MIANKRKTIFCMPNWTRHIQGKYKQSAMKCVSMDE